MDVVGNKGGIEGGRVMAVERGACLGAFVRFGFSEIELIV